jgi:rhodanese-related sulfurtransferase
MSLKLLFDPENGVILGAQAVGGSGVDKRIDVLATAMAAGLRADALADLELAYAPPFSSAKDPVNMLGYIAENVMSGEGDVVEAYEVAGLMAQGWTFLDVRTRDEYLRGSIPGSINAPLDTLREHLAAVGRGPFVVFCEVGQRGHTATMLLHELGLPARNLDGGYRTWQYAEAAAAGDPRRLVRPVVAG